MKMMTGTSGLEDYVVLGGKGPISIGIKTQVGLVPYTTGLMINMRIRAAVLPENLNENSPSDVGYNVTNQVFPTLPWTNSQPTHASTSLVVSIPPMPQSLTVSLGQVKEANLLEQLLCDLKNKLGLDATDPHIRDVAASIYDKVEKCVTNATTVGGVDVSEAFKNTLDTVQVGDDFIDSKTPKLSVIQGGVLKNDGSHQE